MKDHEKAALVNELTALAKEFGGAQQLRERIARCVLPALYRAASDEREACAVVAQGWGGVYSGCGRVCDDIAKEIRMRSNDLGNRLPATGAVKQGDKA